MPKAPYPISGITDPHLQRVLQDMVDRQSFLEREIERLGGSIPIGMAKRESPAEGIISIPSPGGNGSVRVSKDGVIVSYVNPGQFSGVSSLFTSRGEVGTSSSTLTTLRTLMIRATTFKAGEHIRYEGGGFFLGIGGNITALQIRTRIGGVDIHDFSYTPPTPGTGAWPWFIHGIVTQSGDVGGVVYLNADTSPFQVTRGEVTGSGTDRDLILQMRIVVSAGTGVAQNETWNVTKIHAPV